MNFSTIVDGLAALSCAYAGYCAIRFNNAAKRYERLAYLHKETLNERYGSLGSHTHYSVMQNELRPAASPDAPQTCGGCGKSLSPSEIMQCPGLSCPHYQESGFADVDTELAQRKLNAGYIGNLHTTKVFGIK